MAADVNVLREYLVSLGIKVDEEGAKKLSTNLAGWDKQALSLSTRLAGVATAAAAAVGVFSYQMEKLYFASKLSQSSANNLQSLEYGASRIGIGGDRMRATVESIARTVRGNPGVTGLLNSFGIKVTGRDTSDVAKDLMHYLGQMSKFDTPRANAIGRIFGISEDDIYMWGKFEAEAKAAMADQQRMAVMMGVNVDKAAEAGHEVINIWRELKQAGTLFAEGLAAESLPMLEEMKNGAEEMLASILRGVRVLHIAAQDNNDWMKIQNDDLREMVGALHQVLMDWKAILATGDVLNRIKEGLGIKETGGGVHLSAESNKRLGGGESDNDSYDVTDPHTGEHRKVKKKWLDKKFDQFMKWAGAKGYESGLADQASVDAAQDDAAFKRGGTAKGLSGPNDPRLTADVHRKTPENWVPNGRGGFTYKPSMQDKLTRGARNNNPGNIEYGRFAQEHGAIGSDGRFAIFPDMAAGQQAMHELLMSYRGGGTDTIEGIVKRWAPASDGNDTAGYIADVSQRTGLRQNQRLSGDDYAALERAMAMRESGVKLGDIRGDAATGPARATSAGNAINQTNHITVNGSSDPKKAASEVAEQQRQVNSDLLRNNLTRVY